MPSEYPKIPSTLIIGPVDNLVLVMGEDGPAITFVDETETAVAQLHVSGDIRTKIGMFSADAASYPPGYRAG